jgi:hypothetical protein
MTKCMLFRARLVEGVRGTKARGFRVSVDLDTFINYTRVGIDGHDKQKQLLSLMPRSFYSDCHKPRLWCNQLMFLFL